MTNACQVLRSIEMLLMAADFVDRRESELSDHGYASTHMVHRGSFGGGSSAGRQRRRSVSRSSTSSLSPSLTRSSGGIRSLHNEMEKTRRANLRHSLDRLKNVMPSSELAKNTTLQLLKRAKIYIAKLEHDQVQHQKTQSELIRQQAELNRALMMLTHNEEAKVIGAAASAGVPISVNGSSAATRYRLRSGSAESESSEAASPSSRQSSEAGPFFNYRYRADSFTPSASSRSTAESASDISDDIDIMGTGSDSDEYGH